jgi:hypothetical protein
MAELEPQELLVNLDLRVNLGLMDHQEIREIEDKS